MTLACPSEDALIAIVDGEGMSLEIERHLDECETCRAIVSTLASEVDTSKAERYQVLGECGRGGQSRVLRVFDHWMQREVALKEFVDRDVQVSSSDRCLREVWAAGRVSHPAVLPPHEFGVRPNGASYYTMPLVEGQTLATVVAAASRFEDRVRLLPHVLDVAQAVAAAHVRGVLHRDLKPTNVMVGDFGETRVLDWGLATVSNGQMGASGTDLGIEATQQGAVVGTPAYMSPEQARGAGISVGPRSDVWSLGGLLYFVLSGRPPVAGSSEEVLARVRDGVLDPLRSEDGPVPPELAAIVSKAMQPDPAHRYAGASAFASEIVAFMSGAPVQAYRYRWIERARRFAGRHRVFLGATATVTIVLVAALTVSLGLYRRERIARADASMALLAAEDARGAALDAERHARRSAATAAHELAIAHVRDAERLRVDGRPLESAARAALAVLDESLHPRGPRFDPDARGWMEGPSIDPRALGMWLLRELDPIIDADPVVAWSRRVESTAHNDQWRGFARGEGDVQIVDIRSGRETVRLGGHAVAMDVALAVGGQFAATRDHEEVVRLWSLPRGDLLGEWPSSTPQGIAVSSKGDVVFVTPDEDVVLHRVDGSTLVLGSGDSDRRTFAFDRAGERLLIGTRRGVLERVSLSDPQARPTWRFEPYSLVIGLAFAHHDDRVAASLVDGRIAVGRWDDPEPRVWPGPPTSATRIAWSPDDRVIVSAGIEGAVRGRWVDRGDADFVLSAPSDLPLDLEVTARSVAVHDREGTRSWSWRAVPVVRFPARVRTSSLFVTAEGVFVPASREARISNVADPASSVALEGVGAPIHVRGRDHLRWTLHDDGRVVEWAVEGGRAEVRRSWAHAASPSLVLATCPSSGWKAAEVNPGTIGVWRDDEPPIRLESDDASLVGLECSPDGSFLVSVDARGQVRRWPLAGIEAGNVASISLGTFEGWARSIAFEPVSGATFIAGRFGLWRWGPDATHGEAWSTEAHHCVSVAEGRVAALELGGGVKIYDAEGHVWADLRTLGDRDVGAVVLAPDGRSLDLVGSSAAWHLHLDDAFLGWTTSTLRRRAGVTDPAPRRLP